MIYITGDTHGLIDFDKLITYFADKYISYKDYLIILGDGGVLWSDVDNHTPKYEALGITVIYLDGNHENFNMLEKLPIIKKFGCKIHQISEHIYHAMRGEILNINGLSFLTVGGATSIDKANRTIDISWWPQENILKKDIKHAIKSYKKHKGKVDYVLTHCGPTSIAKNYFPSRMDNDTDLLDKLKNKVEFDHWYFGHYHEDILINDKFRCFYYDTIILPNMNIGSNLVTEPIYQYKEGKNTLFVNKKKSKVTYDDLPEWYIKIDNNYISLKDVNSINSNGNDYDIIFDNNKISINQNYIFNFLLGLEKYNSNNFDEVKSKINSLFDEKYNSNKKEFVIRPFVTSEAFAEKKYKYIVFEGNRAMLAFKKLEDAQEYAFRYIDEILRLETVNASLYHGENDYEVIYTIGEDMNNWIFIKDINNKKGA